MAFDISRNTFNPLNDYLGVVMQQGRVHLDSDWNELVAEFTRRANAGALDLVGLSGAPSTTPGAFQISVTPPDSAGNVHVTIGVGRIYVDGILAENHGSASTPQWEPTLGEISGSPGTPTDYTAQPYVLGATLPSLGTGPYLVYLDVWQRDVSYLQDPSLVDQAIGVDTTGRLQTVWQVKLLDVSGVSIAGGFAGSTPDSAIWSQSPAIASGPIWQTLNQGSPSLLTNGPATGYMGQENQLYRVEIHRGGVAAPSSATLPLTYAPGMATFKWSRENASVATTVTAITTVTNPPNNQVSQLTVVSLGRDQVLGFSPGDWIEIIDDYLELNGTSAQAGSASSMQSGELHQIVSVNVAALTITLEAQVNATNFPVTTTGLTDPARHTRIRRWDQSGTVYLGNGQIPWANVAESAMPVPPPGTSLILENGIAVAFDLSAANGAFQTGDYWTFPARAADGSVEPLTRAVPAGIDHHTCRLAILDFTASPPVVTDCRTVFQSLSNPAIHVTNISSVSGTPLPFSGGTLSVQDLAQGINIFFDSPIDMAITNGTIEPICCITVQLPDTAGGWFTPVILAGRVTVDPAIPRSITWTPAPGVESALLAQVSPTIALLARLTLKGDSIWAANGPPFIYLNGAALADGRVYANFDMWFLVNSRPPVALSATALAFGGQTVGTSSAPTLVTLTNNSAGQLTFTGTSFTVIGANAADFAVTNTCGTGIAAGGNCAIRVVFSPTSVAPLQPTRTASISITESIDTTTPLVITLIGTALAPWLLATVSSLNFSATIVGQTSILTVTLSNAGTAPLSISQISISGTPAAPAVATALAAKIQEAKTADIKTADKAPEVKVTETKIPDKVGVKEREVVIIPPGSTSAPGDFGQTSNCVPPAGGTLQPGQPCTITVSFTPSATGVRSAYLNVTHNAAGSLNSISLTGAGIPRKKDKDKDIADKSVVEKITDKNVVEAVLTPSTVPTAPAEKPSGEAEDSAALKSFITPEERPSVKPPASHPSKGAKPKNRPKPR